MDRLQLEKRMRAAEKARRRYAEDKAYRERKKAQARGYSRRMKEADADMLAAVRRLRMLHEDK